MAKYEVINQRQTTIIDSGGQLVPVMEVKFRTEKGVVGVVDVPIASYTVDHVRQMIEARSATIDAVHALGSGS
jgi:hypothetical protein